MQAETCVVDALKEEVDIAERLQVDNDFYDGA